MRAIIPLGMGYTTTHIYALLGLSTSYFGGIMGFPTLPYLRNLQKKKGGKKRIRVYMDGCFDLMHYGNSNALGNELVVGLVSDEEIVTNNGPPVLSITEVTDFQISLPSTSTFPDVDDEEKVDEHDDEDPDIPDSEADL
ncbi:Rossmann-like alpha/beta/alpha sandwich fold [Cynara cardunculus var. scolymus]|uniref:Rossmann-like alpha/beta/alpha sandwich fold n=1 Tax=Cynara cardunculus var. scolymus TaxID=59895 RepID=A0A103Y2Z3_CYNCS|nr:Rossmann-like alpha/beta/alpha sandwich fold [Cynara cardunculus var. scolymus]